MEVCDELVTISVHPLYSYEMIKKTFALKSQFVVQLETNRLYTHIHNRVMCTYTFKEDLLEFHSKVCSCFEWFQNI